MKKPSCLPTSKIPSNLPIIARSQKEKRYLQSQKCHKNGIYGPQDPFRIIWHCCLVNHLREKRVVTGHLSNQSPFSSIPPHVSFPSHSWQLCSVLTCGFTLQTKSYLHLKRDADIYAFLQEVNDQCNQPLLQCSWDSFQSLQCPQDRDSP